MWDLATLALTLLAIDPKGLGGAVIRARSGPVRDAFRDCFDVLPQPLLKLHPTMDDETLFGGIDLTETLSAGKVVLRKGLIGRDGTPVLSMAERCEPALAARLAMALDAGDLVGLIALDEGAEPDETTPATVTERLAFHIDLNMPSAQIGLLPDQDLIDSAKAKLGCISAENTLYETLINLCLHLGIHSQRAPLFALRTARAHAALHGNSTINSDDIEIAAALTLAHRATSFPQIEDETVEEASQNQSDATDIGGETDIGPLDDRILEAVTAMLPDGLLDQFKPKGSLSKGSGAGAKSKSNRRGRPKPSRAGRLSGRNRLDLIATLRAAAPWQKLRGAPSGRVKVAPSDFRIRQFEEKSDRLLIFAVDASGSAAMARLAEAKGAVELLLADAYSRRDHVSLISFRGDAADVLLPPTRSLVQTKKRLAALPGGGGTPLAAGLVEALKLSQQALNQGMSPCIVLLTDGRANVALDGAANRGRATQDAENIAAHIRATGVEAITLDLGNRPTKFLAELAGKMDGLYMPLPRADARKMSGAIAHALKD